MIVPLWVWAWLHTSPLILCFFHVWAWINWQKKGWLHGTKDLSGRGHIQTVQARQGCYRQVSQPISCGACCSNLVPQPCEGLLHLSGLGEGGGRCARLPGAGAMVIMPAVDAAAACIHEEVADGAELQAKLLGNGDLHFLGWTLVLFEDSDECTPLQVSED